MAALEHDFVELTDEAAAREKGTGTAPCRALVYSDSRRAARATLGADVLAALGGPLDLLLTSATWLTSALAEKVLARAREVFETLRATSPDGTVDLATCWFACMPVLHGDAVAAADALQAEFWRRWTEILAAPEGASRVHASSVDIADRVRAAFGERGTGWTTSRYLSPDVMIAATDAAAVARGEFELVLGELHVAMNTLGASLFVNQHPDRALLDAETDRDLPGPRLFPMLPKEHRSRLSARIRHTLDRPRDYHVALVDHTVGPHRPRAVRSADVLVEDRDGRLAVVLPDGAVFDLVDVFSHVLTTLVVDRFRLLPDADRTPRVTIDRMVVARQTWRFTGGELDFAADKSEARRFVRTRRWRAAEGLPRFVFVVSPTEPRPFYVDFDSPLYVNLFVKAARRLARSDAGARLVVTEMLPTPEQVWLTDDRGERYTSELRFVAVDPKKD
jgi:Lantibiotic dehydratase, N terminus